MNQPLDQAGVLPLEARTTSQKGDEQTNYGYRGIKVSVHVTASSSGSIAVKIIGIDGTGQDDVLLTSANLTGAGTTQLRVHPELTAATNTIAKDAVPRLFRIDVTANNSNPITYQISYSMLK